MAEDFAASIEDYLVGLAASLQHAQRQLSELPVVGDGSRPSVTYQLPKLDFELKLSLEVTEDSSRSTPSGSGVALRGRLLNAVGSRSQAAEAASTIKGSFIAVPLSGGTPPPVLTTTLGRIGGDQLSVVARLQTATGEPLGSVPVHFNVDRTLADKLNEGINVPTALPVRAVVRTEADGTATNLVDATDDVAGTRVPVTVEALGRSTTVVFTVEAPGGADPDEETRDDADPDGDDADPGEDHGG